MTIVAGFRCSDGVVLCADTQEVTQGYLKTSVPKLSIRPVGSVPENIWAVFAGAGDGPLIDKLVAEMWEAAIMVPQKFKVVAKAMEEALKKYYEELTTLYQPGDPKYPSAEIIYSVSVEGITGLFKATGPIVNPVERYETAGAGEIIAKYIAEGFWPKIGVLSTREAIILALHLLRQCKEHADGCGGESHIVVIPHSGKPSYLDSTKVSAGTFSLWNTELIARRLYLTIPDMDLTLDQFTAEIGRLLNMIQHTRKMHQDFVENVMKQLKPVEPKALVRRKNKSKK